MNNEWNLDLPEWNLDLPEWDMDLIPWTFELIEWNVDFPEWVTLEPNSQTDEAPPPEPVKSNESNHYKKAFD